jgi:hypothetical protein
LVGRGNSGFGEVVFFKCIAFLSSSTSRTYEHIIIIDFDFFSRESDNSLDKGNVSAFWDKNDDISSLQCTDSWGDFVYDDEIALMKFGFHTLSNDGEWIEDEKSDEEDHTHYEYQK